MSIYCKSTRGEIIFIDTYLEFALNRVGAYSARYIRSLTMYTISGQQVNLLAPVYVLPDSMYVEPEAHSIRGRCLFPSTDNTVVVRRDHANICHAMFVVWNCGHIWAHWNGAGRLFALETSQSAEGKLSPDTEIDFFFKVTSLRKVSGVFMGSAVAEFSCGGRHLLTVRVEKFLEEKI